MPIAADARRLDSPQAPPVSSVSTSQHPYASELRALRRDLEDALDRLDECDPAFTDAAIYAVLEADSRLQVVVAMAQREMEISATERRIQDLSASLAGTQERRGRARIEDELRKSHTYLHSLETRPVAPTDGHEEMRRDLLRRIGWLREVAS